MLCTRGGISRWLPSSKFVQKWKHKERRTAAQVLCVQLRGCLSSCWWGRSVLLPASAFQVCRSNLLCLWDCLYVAWRKACCMFACTSMHDRCQSAYLKSPLQSSIQMLYYQYIYNIAHLQCLAALLSLVACQGHKQHSSAQLTTQTACWLHRCADRNDRLTTVLHYLDRAL